MDAQIGGELAQLSTAKKLAQSNRSAGPAAQRSRNPHVRRVAA
jgi:hypothetical protein